MVRIAPRAVLEEFTSTWKLHHRLVPGQLLYADRTTTVQEVGFYHGGDPVYKLVGIPGEWLEQCLTGGEKDERRGIITK